MTEETQGEVAETEVQGEVAEIESVETPEIEQVETVVEEVEVDYEVKSKELEDSLSARQNKIDKQRAALSQSNNKIQELQSQLNNLQETKAPEAPNEDDFETFGEYDEARLNFLVDNKVKKERQEDLIKQQSKLQEDRNNAQQTEFLKTEQTYRQANPNYDRAKKELQDHMTLSPVSGAVGDAIYEQASRDGMLPDVINYFGDNSGEKMFEFERISSLSPIEAAVEVYKIQQSLKSAPEKTKVKPLPKPLKTIKGTSKAGKSLLDMNPDELKKAIYKGK